MTTPGVGADGPLDGEVTIQYSITSISAQSGTDFIISNGTVTFSAGETTQHLSVIVSLVSSTLRDKCS